MVLMCLHVLSLNVDFPNLLNLSNLPEITYYLNK